MSTVVKAAPQPRDRSRRRLRLTALGLAVAGLVAIGVIVVIRHFEPRAPTATGGESVSLVATGMRIPDSFAFAPDGAVFAGDGGGDSAHPPRGGVFVLGDGSATRLSGSPYVVSGLAWHGTSLYISAGTQLLRWTGWNGHSFAHRAVIYSGPPGFPGFNGLAFGPDGRIYVGVTATTDDHGPTSLPYARDILSFTATGTDLRVFARGIRQPWQIAFPPGSEAPFVSDLGQDGGADVRRVPDFVLRVHSGEDYGFPTCNWVLSCQGVATPWRFLAPHTDPMGLAIIAGRLYVSEYGDVRPTAVVSIPLAGGPIRPVLTHFEQLVIGLAAHDGWLYVGDGDGNVFKVRPAK
jgi:glucose/arabinose dehydrogenase